MLVKPNFNNIQKVLKLENKKKLTMIRTYKIFYKNIEKQKNNFLKLLQSKALKNSIIVGYGATAKATTLLSYYEIPKKTVKIIIDDSKIKENY